MNVGTMEWSSDDLPLLTEVLDTLPVMHNAAHAVKIIERHLSYPISSVEVLLSVFDGVDHIKVRNCRITPQEVRFFLPETCFPIDNRSHLIAHVIMAFERERVSVFSRAAAGPRPLVTKGHEDV